MASTGCPDGGVQLAGVRKAFGAVEAVRGADLTVPVGSIVAVVGPSGCGKTTMLRLVAGFESPDAGTICVGGQQVAGDRTFVPPERRRVGMVFQQLALFPHLTVGGNVAFGLGGRRRGADVSRRVGELLELVGMSGYERRYPEELSGGQAQRVALARALAPEPAVVLLDEPFSSLDVSLRAGVRREVRRILCDAGATALLVTHDQDEALAMGDRVAVMLDGVVAQVGRPEEVYRRPATPEVAAFLGDANLVEGVVRGGVLHTELGPLPVGSPDGPAFGLVRPEDLDLVEVDPGASGETGPRGRVVAVEYYGHDQLVTVVLPSGRALDARLHARRRFPEGTEVGVRVGGLGVVAFPAPGAASALDGGSGPDPARG